MSGSNAIKRRVATDLAGSDVLKGLLKSKGYTQARLAREKGHTFVEVTQCLHGDRPRPEIRDDLAEILGLPRNEIDRLIDGA